MLDYVLELLCAFVNGTEPKPSCEKVNTDELFKFAYYQKLLGIFSYMSKRKRLFDEAASREFEKAYYTVVSENTLRIEAFKRLSERLSENGIEHMPVKGYYLRELYPVKELRSFGDIDFLIHSCDRKKCDSIMKSLGYEVKNDWEPTYSYLKGNEYYEIHTNLFDVNLKGRADMEEYFSSAWSFAEKKEGLCFELNIDFHFIYVVCHIAKHLSGGGAGIRMYLDVALLLKQLDGELSWDYIKSEFEKLGLYRFFTVVMSAAESWFGVKSCCEFERVGESELARLLSYTLDADIYGSTRDNTLARLHSQERESRLMLFLKMLFPSKGVLIRRYTFLRYSSLLLPVAWVVRFFKNLGRLGEQIKSIKRLKAVDSSNRDTYNGFMKSIGL